MKILILIIYSKSQDYYDKMLEIQRKYVHNYENVDVYFAQSSFEYNDPVVLVNDMFYVRGIEEYNTILYKSLSVMEALKNVYKKEYDFTIRSNISTLINIPKMIEYLSLYQEKEYIYDGIICGVNRLNRPIRFALGIAIILSKQLVNKMINEKEKFNHKLEDDVAFGLFVEENISSAYENNLLLSPFVFYTNSLENGYNTILNDVINFLNKNKDENKLKYICYRNSLANRNEDAKIMDYICNTIILPFTSDITGIE